MRCIVYIRSAAPRQGPDPPIYDWDAKREQELWAVLQGETFEWDALAAQFGVSRQYILQQAAWLYEKELHLLKARMNHISLPQEHQRDRSERRLISMQRVEESSEESEEEGFV